jgi:hypothetical protein
VSSVWPSVLKVIEQLGKETAAFLMLKADVAEVLKVVQLSLAGVRGSYLESNRIVLTSR